MFNTVLSASHEHSLGLKLTCGEVSVLFYRRGSQGSPKMRHTIGVSVLTFL